MLIVVLAAGLLTHFFPCCAFAIRSFSKVSATPDALEEQRAEWLADPGKRLLPAVEGQSMDIAEHRPSGGWGFLKQLP